jgi:hypothetical protein
MSLPTMIVSLAVVSVYSVWPSSASRAVLTKATLSHEVSMHASDRIKPWLNLGDGRNLLTPYAGDERLRQTLERNQAEPRSLTSADFDEDGVNDLVCGYAGPEGGILTLHRGNVDAIHPNAPEAQQRRDAGEYTDAPFLSPGFVFGVPEAADFINAGDFDADGHWDVVAAARGGDQLFLLSGDGKAGLSSPIIINLPGRVTALAVGEVNRKDGLEDLVVGITGAMGSQALVFEGPEGALRSKPEILALPAEAGSLALGQLEGDGSFDLVAATGREILIFEGRDRKLSLDRKEQAAVRQAEVQRRYMPFIISSLTVGNFSGRLTSEVAMMAEDGGVFLLRKEEMGQRLEEWGLEEASSGKKKESGDLISARVSGFPSDDLVAIDRAGRKLHIIARAESRKSIEGLSVRSDRDELRTEMASLDAEGEPVTALAMRLNDDALSDLVILRAGQTAPIMAPSAPASIITVNSNLDTNNRDSLLTLREAILISNGELSVGELSAEERAQVSGTPASPGMDEIRFNLPAGASSSRSAPEVPDPVLTAGRDLISKGNQAEYFITPTASRSSNARAYTQSFTSSQQVFDTPDAGSYLDDGAAGMRADAGFDNETPAGDSSAMTTPFFTNPPVLTSATSSNGNLRIIGTLNDTPNSDFFVQFFFNTQCNDGNPQVLSLPLFIQTNSNGNASFDITFSTSVSSGFIFATATDPSSNTSAPSNCVQISGGCSFSISPTSANFSASGGQGSFTVTTAAGCAWTAGTNVPWISIPFAGSGSGTVNYSVEANTGSARSGMIFIEGLAITVNQQGAANCAYAINPSSQNFPASGGASSFNVTAPGGCAWSALSDVPWITTSSTGSGNGTVTFSVAANPNSSPRTGHLTIADQVFTVTQDGAVNCTFSISPTSQSFPASGGAGSVNVTAPGGCNWTATSNDPFITITSGGSGSGNGTVGYSVLANTGSSRSGTLTIAGQTYTVSQSGAVNCTFTINPTSQTFFPNGGGGTVTVTAPAGCEWTAASNDSFITITSGIRGTGNGTVSYSVMGNATNNTRTGTLTIAGQTFTVSQTASTPCTFSISPTSQSFPASGGAGSVNVTAPGGCNWTATSNDPFITITSGGSGSGNGTVGYFVLANTTNDTRIGTMTIAGQSFTVSQTAADTCTFTINPTSQDFSASAGTGTVTVTAPAGCDWTAISNTPSFISITSSAGGRGNGTVTYSVAANTAATPRSGTLTIAGITFTVTQGGNSGNALRTINLASPLPRITDPVIIDGTSQSGFVGTPIVELNAANARGADILSISAGNSLVKGLVINRFNSANRVSGIVLLTNGGNTVEGCFIGPDASGTRAADGPAGPVGVTSGISIRGATNNRIGGTAPLARNVFSGNDGAGIIISNGATGNRVQGNHVGPDVTGNVSLGNQRIGIIIIGSSGNAIGGRELGAGNLISGNLEHGVFIQDDSSNNTIQGNSIGTDALGIRALANADSGVQIVLGNGTDAPNNTIGGTDAAARNIISGNGSYGVIVSSGVTGTQIQGNYIGTNRAGTGALGNRYGLTVTRASRTTIGGDVEGARNVISGNFLIGVNIGFLVNGQSGGTGTTLQGNFIGTDATGSTSLGNRQDGVFVEVNSITHTIKNNRIAFNGGSGIRIPDVTANPGDPGVQINIETNSTYSNEGLGIDIHKAGPDANDEFDRDLGANLQQNYPVITSVTVSAGGMRIIGFLSSEPSMSYFVQFFSSPACQGSNPRQGQQVIGQPILYRTGPDGMAPIDVFIPNAPASGYVNAAASDSRGNSSEFSPCFPVGSGSSNPGPTITGVALNKKNLVVSGDNFVQDSKILLKGREMNTKYGSATSLSSKKAGKKVRHNDKIQVRNPDGSLSNEWTYQQP